ncbi:hypothetical protein J437_LFUL000486 [Ladona fulva]|uniref:Ig-like domain-containing protein n=1 Tax=Ladona fulva TaxID=123851 RepID=A0A8K0KKT1_LADFU|nr:hypothetical protein J437_LFUL000486 [Ladona fulva]
MPAERPSEMWCRKEGSEWCLLGDEDVTGRCVEVLSPHDGWEGSVNAEGGAPMTYILSIRGEKGQNQNEEISWIRRRDWHILTSGLFTYTNDERFQVLHAEGSDDWTLQIKYVQKRDNGTYECQGAPVSIALNLTLPYYAISGVPNDAHEKKVRS